MTSKRFASYLVLSVSFLLVLTGCNKGPDVQFIEGTVTVDGKIIADCMVTFCPLTVSEDWKNLDRPILASGNTNAEGYFVLSSTQGGEIGGGTTAGEYDVCIVKKNNSRPPVKVDRDGRPVGMNPNDFRPQFKYETPEIFELQAKTPIKKIVVNKGKNRFDFALKSDGTFTINGQ